MKKSELKIKLLELFKRQKNNLIKPYKDIKKELMECPEYMLRENYNVHIEELKFYGLIK